MGGGTLRSVNICHSASLGTSEWCDFSPRFTAASVSVRDSCHASLRSAAIGTHSGYDVDPSAPAPRLMQHANHSQHENHQVLFVGGPVCASSLRRVTA